MKRTLLGIFLFIVAFIILVMWSGSSFDKMILGQRNWGGLLYCAAFIISFGIGFWALFAPRKKA
ncbi:MAG: hypothetical protein A2Z96_03710 [Spirochaetes bacterium GWB1_48_6]|nr:MAG: hypothetical protein UX14_C0024G0006 [Parcubacteria group bacterium GW2011_GWF1_45_5]OHD12225.1 MAG: hypothetical protein A2Z96_03710 [Spirochaetes bacterium GWB1_48_6]